MTIRLGHHHIHLDLHAAQRAKQAQAIQLIQSRLEAHEHKLESQPVERVLLMRWLIGPAIAGAVLGMLLAG